MPSIQAHHLAAFRRHLQGRERRPATVEKYCREVRAFARGMKPGQVVTKELVLAWKRTKPAATPPAPSTGRSPP